MYPYSELCLKSIYDVFRQNGYDTIRDRSLDTETPTKLLVSSNQKKGNMFMKKFLRVNDGKAEYITNRLSRNR